MPPSSRRRTTLGLTVAALAIGALGVITPLSAAPSIAAPTAGSHGSDGRFQDAGDEAGELMESLDQFAEIRTAPSGLVVPGAYAAAYADLSALPANPAAWSPVTNVRYNADDPRYRDPGASNSGGGAGNVTGDGTTGSATYVGAASTDWRHPTRARSPRR